MPTLTINDKEIEVPAGLTVLQACELAGFEIPRFFRFSAEPLPRIASGKIFKRRLRDETLVALGRPTSS